MLIEYAPKSRGHLVVSAQFEDSSGCRIQSPYGPRYKALNVAMDAAQRLVAQGRKDVTVYDANANKFYSIN